MKVNRNIRINKNGGKKALVRSFIYAIGHFIGCKFGASHSRSKVYDRMVFICKGNVCRSALAEHIAKSQGYSCSVSFGLDTQTGIEPDNKFFEYCRNSGYDYGEHRALSVEDYKYQSSDLLICMEPCHAIILRKAYPTADICYLGEFHSPKRIYIHDPYGASAEYYSNCVALIENSVEKLILTCMVKG